MLSNDLYLHAQASLFAILQSLKINLSAISPNLTVFKWDAANDATSLPETDLIGPFKMIVTNEDGLLTVAAQIVVCTLNDPNLFRLDEIINQVFNHFAPNKRLPLVDARTGAPLGILVVSDETTVLPVERANSRPIKSVAIEIRSDRSLPR